MSLLHTSLFAIIFYYIALEVSMNIKTDFLNALVSRPRLSPGQNPEDFLGCIVSFPKEDGSPLLHLLSFGNIKASAPWSFDISSLDCCLFLYTKSGCGKLTVNSQVYTLGESSLLFFDCRQRFRFDIAVSPWEYQLLLFCGASLTYYCSLLPQTQVPLIQLPPYSELATCMKNIAVRAQIPGTCSRLIISDLLNRMVTEYLTGILNPDASLSQIPAHVRKMKEMFDERFQDLYTLDGLEEHFGISKYRLCREFSHTYQAPPLQYLNRKRIDHAAGLLTSTNLLIHEIGSMVGIDNTNHFINLFKKYRGVTPLEYRQRMTH